MLYLVATPLGNLSEMTPRAVETLQNVAAVFCEDTRHFMKLSGNFNIKTRRVSFHQNSNPEKVLNVLQAGKSAALVCDAGAPTISDPGYKLVQAAIAAGYAVSPIGINSAFLAALICSGFPTRQFQFWGFMPLKKGRQTFITKLAEQKITTIFYESSHRIVKMLKQMSELAPQLQICVAKELTKIHERFLRGTAAEILLEFEANPQLSKGEFTVVVAPK